MLKKKKSQSSLEFALILGVVFVVLIAAIIIIQRQAAESIKQITHDKAEELGNIIRAEIQNAKSSQGAYSRRFLIPETIDGKEYQISLENNTEISISIEDYDYVIFLHQSVMGNIGKGWNLIEKKQGINQSIMISALS